MQIIGMNLVKFGKFKATAAHQLFELQTKAEKSLSIDFFRREHTELETRIKEVVDTKIGYYTK